MANAIQRIEGHLGSILAALHVTESQHLSNLSPDKRREKLLDMVIDELKKLKMQTAAFSMAIIEKGEDEAADALSRRMGWSPERERAQQEELAKRFKR